MTKSVQYCFNVRKSHCTGVSTFASPASPSTDQSLQKSFHLSDPRKIELKKISSPSENKKYATAHTTTTEKMTVKLNNDNGLQRWTDRRPTGNSRLASCGVTCLNSSAVLLFSFGGMLTVQCSEIPHERQAPNRQAVKKVVF